MLHSVLEHSFRVFKRAVVMPNLYTPITTIDLAENYRKDIISALPAHVNFEPLMTAYLTDDFDPDALEIGYQDKVFFAAKLYPANATTNSSKGVTDIKQIGFLLEIMERIGMPLLIHGEVNDPSVDIFDRESEFIERHLKRILDSFPSLKVVLEHITTEKAISFVEENSTQLAATITPHHLYINRNAMFNGGLLSDFYCLPVAKREHHRLALREAATSGKKCFFLGTDSAPHLRSSKESSCSCAGIFNAPFALESYVQVFEDERALDKLEDFTSVNGPAFYGLEPNKEKITLLRQESKVPLFYEFISESGASENVVPFHAGEQMKWSVVKS